MKEQDDKLTLQETEQLCRLYMDCNLSVLEENELRYVLSQVDYTSPLIEEVRQIMTFDTNFAQKPLIKNDHHKSLLSRKWMAFLGIAASIVLVISIGFSFFNASSSDSMESESYYIAYVNGQRVSDKEAKSQIDAEKKYADDFIKEMSDLEAHNQQMINNFFNP